MSHAAFSKSDAPATRPAGAVPARTDVEPSIGQLVAQAAARGISRTSPVSTGGCA